MLSLLGVPTALGLFPRYVTPNKRAQRANQAYERSEDDEHPWDYDERV
jgi:hypothetical protein